MRKEVETLMTKVNKINFHNSFPLYHKSLPLYRKRSNRRKNILSRESGKISSKELDAETGFYYYGARYLDPRTSRWLSGDPALGEYLPAAPVNDEAKKGNGNLPGQGGVFNLVNLHVYHYAGNNPVKYQDPEGRKIVSYMSSYSMSNFSENLGNSKTDTIQKSGCYITSFANIFAAAITQLPINMSRGLNNARSYSSPTAINNDKSLFGTGSGNLNGRENSMNDLFGKGNWDYWTKENQGANGLSSKLKEYESSGKNFMLVGIFDLSGATKGVDNHMVGITGLPNKDGVFENVIVGSSNGDTGRLRDPAKAQQYNINNLKEIRVIFVDN
jgi:RHS repeat-associated protein